MKRTAILVPLVVLLATLEAQAPRVTNASVDASRFPQVTAQFDVLSGDSEFVESLPSTAVTVVEGAQNVRGSVAPAASSGTSYSVVIDTSLSMKDAMPAVREALAAFVDRLGPKDKVALLTVAEEDTPVVPLTADRSRVSAALRTLEPKGRRTNLFYAVWKSLDAYPAGEAAERRVMLLVSDGRDEIRSYSQEDCVKEAASRGVNIVSLGVATGPDGTAYLPNIQKLAWLSGGIYLHVDDAASWPARLQVVERYVNARRSLTWTSTLPPDGQVHDAVLRIEVQGASISQVLHVATRPPEGTRVAWWRSAWLGLPVWAWLVIGVVLLALLAFGAAALARRSTRTVQALESQIRDAEEGRAKLESTMKVRFDEVQERLKEGGDRAPAKADPGASAEEPSHARTAAAEGLAPVFDKRRTVFQSGSGLAMPLQRGVYTRGALRILQGPLAGSTLPLLDGRTSIGREDDNNIVLNDPKVSSYHAAVTRRDGCFWLEDCNSTNGTYLLDGLRILSPLSLVSGQRIKAGDVIMEFCGEA